MTTLPDIAKIETKALVALISSEQEFAILDAREIADIREEGTLLNASWVALAELELKIRGLIPRLDTRVILVDGQGASGGAAEDLAARLGALGYTALELLAGGVAAWRAAGLKLFPSPYVVAQSFGEFVHDVYDTPRISASDLQDRQARGDDILILDSRTPEEFRRQSLPGARSYPGAELALRARDLVQGPETLVVINCAGRTRSIMGAQALINAGLTNPVVALEDGTMGWRLAGGELDHGASDHLSIEKPASLAEATESGRRIADRFGIRRLDAAGFAGFLAERDAHTLFAFDVRTPAEYVAGHHPDARSLPNWVAAPWFSFHAATRNGRIVLLDDADGVRAAVTASWLAQLGWRNVHIQPAPWGKVVAGPAADDGLALPAIASINGAVLEEVLAHDGAMVIDVGSSSAYRQRHVAGALWSSRAALPKAFEAVPGSGLIVFTSQDDRVSALAASDVAGLTDRPVAVLRGGTARWIAEDRVVASGGEGLLVDPRDVFVSPWRDGESGFEAFKEYLRWEKALAQEIREDETVQFRAFAPA